MSAAARRRLALTSDEGLDPATVPSARAFSLHHTPTTGLAPSDDCRLDTATVPTVGKQAEPEGIHHPCHVPAFTVSCTGTAADPQRDRSEPSARRPHTPGGDQAGREHVAWVPAGARYCQEAAGLSLPSLWGMNSGPAFPIATTLHLPLFFRNGSHQARPPDAGSGRTRGTEVSAPAPVSVPEWVTWAGQTRAERPAWKTLAHRAPPGIAAERTWQMLTFTVSPGKGELKLERGKMPALRWTALGARASGIDDQRYNRACA